MNPDHHHNALNQNDMLHWYEIKSILGQGGFGITYLAHDTNLDCDVAIKEYLPTEFSTRDASSTVQPISENHSEIFNWGKTRFLEEAKTLFQFKHANIVRVLSFFENNNTGYMVMEYEEGSDLSDLIKSGENFDETRLLKIIIPILEGLKLVHAQGFIHRDIKPQNIFIRTDGSPVLIDFGSARQALGGQTRTMTSLVTPGYAPFEQYHDADGKQGPWTDIYALGATLYCAITGKAPVDALKRGMARVEHNTDAYLQLCDLKAERYSAHFLEAIDCALRFIDKERPQTVDTWMKMLLGEMPVPTAGAAIEQLPPAAEIETVLHQPAQPASEAATQVTKPSPARKATEPEVTATVATDPEAEDTVESTIKPQAAVSKPEKSGKPLWMAGLLVFIGILIAAYFYLQPQPASPPAVTEISPEEASEQQLELDKLQAQLEQKSNQLKQAEAARLAEEQRQQQAAAKAQEEIEKQQLAEKEAARLAAEKQQQIEMETARLAAEKKQREELARQQALKKEQAEKAKKAELERQARAKKQAEELARQAAEKKRQEQQAREAAEKQQQQAERSALAVASVSGRYKAEISSTGTIIRLIRTIMGISPEIIVDLEQQGNTITGIISGSRDGEIEGERNGNKIEFRWYTFGGNGSIPAKGFGSWAINADGSLFEGSWYSSDHDVKGDWKLAKISVSDDSLHQDVSAGKSVTDVPAFAIPGTYIASLSGSNSLFNTISKSPEVTLTLKGKQLNGIVGNNLGQIWGDVSDNRIKFEWYLEGGTNGRGSWNFEPTTGELTGKWTHTSAGDGAWNMVRKAGDKKSVTLDISGRYSAEITSNARTSNYINWVMGKNPQVVVTLELNGDKVKGTFAGSRDGEIEGQLVENRINFRWFTLGGSGGTPTHGKGNWTISPDGKLFQGDWQAVEYEVRGTWNLSRQ